MQKDKETWKWGLVAFLLAVFLITANQAYQHISNQEVFEAPDDYLKGDSYDMEHQNGPGAGQPLEVPLDFNPNRTQPIEESQSDNLEENLFSSEPIVIEDDIDWNQSDSNTTSETNNKPVVNDIPAIEAQIQEKEESNKIQPDSIETVPAIDDSAAEKASSIPEIKEDEANLSASSLPTEEIKAESEKEQAVPETTENIKEVSTTPTEKDNNSDTITETQN